MFDHAHILAQACLEEGIRMPVPRWVARLNRKVFNPMELKKGKRPVLSHVGRTSGNTYQTPLDAHPFDGGFVFVANYGPNSDWVRNILASGSATLTKDGSEYALDNPQLIPHDEAVALIGHDVKLPPSFLKVTDYLRMDIAAS